MPSQKRILSADCPIHVTARTNNREKFPIDLADVWTIFEDYLYLLNRAYSIEIINFLLMPNHFHMIVRDPNLNLPAGMNHLLRESSKEIKRASGKINHQWGNRYYSSVINSLPYYYTCYRYVYRNPVAAGLTKSVLDYEYSSLAVLLGQRKSVLPLAEDLTLFSSVDPTIHWLEQSTEDKFRKQISRSLKHSVMKFSVDKCSRKKYEPSLPSHL